MLIHAGDPGMRDPTQVGHKFARQELLRAAGFRVPRWCCVPVTAFDAVAGDLLAAAPDGGGAEELAAWAAAAAARIRAARPTGPLAAEIGAAARMLAGDGGLVAVRACVVADAAGAGEDGARDPFAGLTDSFLYVPPADVPRRVAECWASALSPESVRYRAHRGLPPASARVAVGIQRMVPGVRSFVAFSRDPRTGAACCVVAAAHGIGEGVVAERADVDHFFIDAGTGAIRAEVVAKRRMVTRGAAGPVARPVPAELAAAPVLADDDVRRVGDLAAAVEELFGAPQDIEGTLTPDGTIFLLQARPVVFGGPEPGPRTAWSNHNLTESFPGVSSALTYSQARVFYRLIFRDAYRRMGVPDRRLRAGEHHLSRMVGLLDGRAYYRLDAWFALHGQVPGFPLIRPWWERSMGLATGHRPGAPALLRALLTGPALAIRLARLPGSVRRFLRWWDRLADEAGDMDGWPPGELIAFYRRLWAEVGRRWGITLVNTFFLLGCATLTSALVRRWATGDEQRILGGLLLGGRENRSVLAVRSAIALAELVARDPSLAERVGRCGEDGGETAEEIWREMVTGRCGPQIAARAREHLHRYGDRAPHDLKLEEPTPRQRPGMIVAVIQPMIRGEVTVAGSRAAERDSRAAAELQLREQCPGLFRRLVIRALAAGLRWFVRVREDTRYCRSQLFGLTRQVMWRLGELLAEAGQLADRSDVADLTVEEVLGAYDGTLVDPDLRGVARRRRADRRAAARRPDLGTQLETPLNVPVAGARPTPAAPAGMAGAAGAGPAGTGAAGAGPSGAGGGLRGLPSSKGVVRGRARVVLDPAISPESCRDRIIVAKETDPGWLFLMMAARGMVVERGTLLSHTAITGRLLGIPTVVAVPGATTLISDGAWLEIDGAAGTVRILQPGPAA
jgi:phosphohistidine swiveling domain-containing protein